MSIADMAVSILKATLDGSKLRPSHLYLLQCAVNDDLSSTGKEAFKTLHEKTTESIDVYLEWAWKDLYPVSYDEEGYIYWRGEHIEHYTEPEKQLRKNLTMIRSRCEHLEALSVPVSCVTVVFWWELFSGISNKEEAINVYNEKVNR